MLYSTRIHSGYTFDREVSERNLLESDLKDKLEKSKLKCSKIIEKKKKRFTVDLGIGKYIFKASVSYILRIGTIFPPIGFSHFSQVQNSEDIETQP